MESFQMSFRSTFLLFSGGTPFDQHEHFPIYNVLCNFNKIVVIIKFILYNVIIRKENVVIEEKIFKNLN